MPQDIDLTIMITNDKHNSDLVWTVFKNRDIIAVGFADSVEQALFYLMNDLYGMKELSRPDAEDTTTRDPRTADHSRSQQDTSKGT